MKHTATLIALALTAMTAATTATAGRFTRHVNPFIGTGAVANSLSGNCYPGATTPFGMVQLSPDTQYAPDWDKASGYDYNDTHICGFSHTRLSGTGACDLIDLLLMPATAPDGLDATTWSAFSHDDEEARPGYYRVRLADSGVNAELTATTRCGIHRYTYPQGAEQHLLIDLDHSAPKGSWDRRIIQSQIRITGPTTVEGYRIITGWARLRRVYFHMELSRPIVAHTPTPTVLNGNRLKMWLHLQAGPELTVKVALSTTSVENARQNMLAEAPHWDFDRYAAEADAQWEQRLSCIEAEGSDENLQKFYTALYHTMIQPNTMSDVDGSYTATDYTTQRMPKGHTYYSTFSLWDTFRAAHPLYTIVAQKENADFVNSMLAHCERYGYLPIWDLWGQDNYCMIANHAIPVVADAVMKQLQAGGALSIDPERALQACVASATISHAGSPFEVWERLGYMPEDEQSQSVSITLEQAFDDWCIAQLARRLGHDDICQRFTRRSQNFRNLYNPDTRFFQARTSDGAWLTPFDPLLYGANGGNPYTEGNAWQYLWYVPHDVEGLIGLMGGQKQFADRLDTFFTLTDSSGERNSNISGLIGQYVHGNEPSHHVAYLYNHAGQPQKTQQMVWRLMHEMYDTTSAGYAGNDDCGEMSAWLVFSALGFYPVNPASGVYDTGTPLLDRAIIHLADGGTFTVTATRRRPDSWRVRSMTLNGRPLRRPLLSHSDITAGGTLHFDVR